VISLDLKWPYEANGAIDLYFEVNLQNLELESQKIEDQVKNLS